MRLRPTPAGVIACVALFVAGTGTAVATTGGAFVLGRPNAESSTASLSNANGTALSLGGGGGKPALAVNNTAKIARLNADLLDGLDSTRLQRRVTGTCAPGSAVATISATGAVTCDDEQALITYESGTIDGTGTTDPGFGVAVCGNGFAVVGGGFAAGTTDPPPPALASVSTPLTYTDPDTGATAELYVVQLTNVDGSPYTAGGTVTARCAYGVAADGTQLGAARRGAVRRSTSSPDQGRAARLYAKNRG